MAQSGYKQFCPLAMASEIICTRWTLMLLRELLLGTSRFNDLRRGLPRVSPALLSKRLRDLELAGVVRRVAAHEGSETLEYRLTEAGQALKPVVDAVGDWGHRWVTTEATLANLDVSLLMWNMRRNIDVEPMPRRRTVIQIIYPELEPSRRNWWLIIEPGSGVDLCSDPPGFDVDLYVTTDLKTMTEIWMGYASAARARAEDRILLTGDRKLAASFETWVGASRFAQMDKCVA